VDIPSLLLEKDFDLEIPDFSYTLLPPQKVGTVGLISNTGVLLRDPVGSGKTIQTYAALSWLKAAGESSLALIVAPKAVAGQWYTQGKLSTGGSYNTAILAGLGPQQRGFVYQNVKSLWGNPGKHIDALICTHGILSSDIEELKKLPIDTIVLDEASVFRHENTKAFKSAEKLIYAKGREILRRIVITATVSQNELLDAYNLGYLADRDLMGSRKYFMDNHCKVSTFPIVMKNGYQTQVKKIIGYKNIDTFVERLNSISIIRPIESFGNAVPQISINDVWVDLTPEQEMYYQDVVSGFLENNWVEPMQRVLRLRQICSDLSLIRPGPSKSTKIDKLVELLGQHDFKDPVVIFSQSLELLRKSVYPILEELQLSYGEINGEEEFSQIEKTKKSFSDGNLNVLCITTAGEMGLNLQRSNHMICLDMLFNEARMRQIYGRIRRIGSPHTDVKVTRILVKNSIEENALKLLDSRGALLDFLDNPEHFTGGKDRDTVLKLINRQVRLLDHK
jgi:SNF2 family DNA or RNA helicase